MELLLLLTAFLASLTGVGQADRGGMRQVQGVAVVQAAQAAQAAVLPARRAAPAVVVPLLRPEKATPLATVQLALAALHLPFERRLE
ncbi:hypothetical protein HZY97_02445 [Sphingomonas sp. R-74633]|uniref:hypothetical protein n=1 Tax=Sphingomonas sp. R-74633 TaxID=2751188 RepID=UPI0015D17A7F|nr:hypothetical protein [Sphingomonas sp. R-74633]NYT39603.1 hypothetical protein [Sphingomonas sp. R-74633]